MQSTLRATLPRHPSGLAKDARERPRIAPDIAVEVWSPGDRRRTLDERIALYLADGSRLVVVVLPKNRTFEFARPGHERERVAAGGIVNCPGYDDLRLDADRLFAGL